MPTYRFERVPWTAKKSVPCTVCGKKIRRQRTFEQTLNPFNKTTDGRVKTIKDIYPELRAKADAWRNEPETHDACRQLEAS